MGHRSAYIRIKNYVKQFSQFNYLIMLFMLILQIFFFTQYIIPYNGWWFDAISRLRRTRRVPYRNPRDYFLEGVLQTPHQLRNGVH